MPIKIYECEPTNESEYAILLNNGSKYGSTDRVRVRCSDQKVIPKKGKWRFLIVFILFGLLGLILLLDHFLSDRKKRTDLQARSFLVETTNREPQIDNTGEDATSKIHSNLTDAYEVNNEEIEIGIENLKNFRKIFGGTNSSKASHLYQEWLTDMAAVRSQWEKILIKAHNVVENSAKPGKKIPEDWITYKHLQELASRSLKRLQDYISKNTNQTPYIPIIVPPEEPRPERQEPVGTVSSELQMTNANEESPPAVNLQDWHTYIPGWNNTEIPIWTKNLNHSLAINMMNNWYFKRGSNYTSNPWTSSSHRDEGKLNYSGVPTLFNICGGSVDVEMTCCMHVLCGSVLVSIMQNVTLLANMTGVINCLNSGNTSSCFNNATTDDPLMECLACNDCIIKPKDLNCASSTKIDVRNYG